MNAFESIDPILLRWADTHAVTLFTSHQGGEVRSFVVDPDGRNRVQIWVDAPLEGRGTIHICQYPNGIGRFRRGARFDVPISELVDTLDLALSIGQDWFRHAEQA